MERRYQLPLEAMVESMKPSPTVVCLQATLPSLPGLSPVPCYARVVVGKGQVYDCTILTGTGTILRDQQEAYHAIAQSGDLDWRVSPAPSAEDIALRRVSSPMQGAVAPSKVPRLTQTVAPETLAALTRRQRHVILLVNGKRSVIEIAHLLHQSREEVQQVMEELSGLVGCI